MARQLLKNGADARVLLIDSPSPIDHVPLDECLIESIANSKRQAAGSDMAKYIRSQFRSNTKLLGKYNPLPGDGPFPRVAVLRSKEGISSGNIPDIPNWLSDRSNPRDAVAKWETLLGCSVRALDIPGNHFEPFSSSNVCGPDI